MSKPEYELRPLSYFEAEAYAALIQSKLPGFHVYSAGFPDLYDEVYAEETREEWEANEQKSSIMIVREGMDEGPNNGIFLGTLRDVTQFLIFLDMQAFIPEQ